MPSSRHATITRSAISPRFAIRIFLNIERSRMRRPDCKQPLAILNGLAVLHVYLYQLPVDFRVDLVHELHRFDDAENLSFLDHLTDLGEWLGTRLWRAIERTDDGRFHDGQFQLLLVDRLRFRRRGGDGRCDARNGRRHCCRALVRVRSRRRPSPSRLLSNAQLELVALELELAELVLTHHFEDLRDLVEIHETNHPFTNLRIYGLSFCLNNWVKPQFVNS